MAESNTAGTVTRRTHYQPFGETIEAPQNDVGYTGHTFDTDLGLSYMQARYYDPVLGRFYGNDPADYLKHLNDRNPLHGFNRYTYANNNPYRYVDPDGELAMFAWFATPPGIAALTKAAEVTVLVTTATIATLAASEMLSESSGAGTASTPENGVRIDDDGSGVVEIGVGTESGEITIVGEPTVSDDGETLTIGGEGGAHIEGPGGGKVGLTGVREAGRKIGESFGVKEVIIQGGERTTGANVGKQPRPVKVKANQ